MSGILDWKICPKCNKHFDIETNYYLCPECRGKNIEIIEIKQKKDILL